MMGRDLLARTSAGELMRCTAWGTHVDAGSWGILQPVTGLPDNQLRSEGHVTMPVQDGLGRTAGVSRTGRSHAQRLARSYHRRMRL